MTRNSATSASSMRDDAPAEIDVVAALGATWSMLRELKALHDAATHCEAIARSFPTLGIDPGQFTESRRAVSVAAYQLTLARDCLVRQREPFPS